MIIFNILTIINLVFGAIFLICYSYQVYYILVSWIKKPMQFPEAEKNKKYAFLISARNEENVIHQLCDCIANQDYPSELINFYVIADNCTDNTAAVAREHGAIVIERFDKEHVGKGYALDYALKHIRDTVGYDAYDAYIIVDADNILEPNYVTEMNKSFSAGNRLIVGYRNSKNYADNWISSGYSLWFLRTCRQLNSVRHNLNLGCEIQGTGFLIHKDIIKRQDGWIHHLLIEDIEFTVDNVLHGEKATYCHDAILYDEQPTTFMQSFWQRKRWCRGYLQVLRGYAPKLLKAFFGGKGFTNFDMVMAISPAFFITVFMMFANIIAIPLVAILDIAWLIPTLISVAVTFISAYFLFFLLGVVAITAEWNRIHTTTGKKLWSLVTFPLFMYTYVPIAASAMFSGVDWKPISHKPVDNTTDIKTATGAKQETEESTEESIPKT